MATGQVSTVSVSEEPPPKRRYQVRLLGKDVEGADFTHLSVALSFADAYPDQVVIDTDTGQEIRLEAPRLT